MQPSQNTQTQSPNIQSALRMLEIEAHTANVPMDQVMTLLERQFITAEIQRRGNVERAAEALHRSPASLYRAMRRLKLIANPKRSEP